LPLAISTIGANPASCAAMSLAIPGLPFSSRSGLALAYSENIPASTPVKHSVNLRNWHQPSGISDMAFYELRQYKVQPGKMNEWLKIMEEEIIPFQVSKGMVICGSFQGETDDSVYVWIRRFERETQREVLYKAVYESDHWKNDISPRVMHCLDRSAMVVTRIIPTGRSTMQ